MALTVSLYVSVCDMYACPFNWSTLLSSDFSHKSFSQPSLTLGYVVAQLLVFPVGKLWEKVLPRWRVPLGKWSFDINPGKFSIKEHAVIVIVSALDPAEWPIIGSPYVRQCVNLSTQTAYASGSLVAMVS